MSSPFHAGELELQRRAGVEDEARAVGRIIGSRIPAGAGRFLGSQRFAVVASVAADGRVWASWLHGPPGFLAAVDDQLIRLAARPLPGDPLEANLAARPELGLLVLDPSTRQRMRFNGRGLPTPEGTFLLVAQAYGNCPKYIQRRALEADAPCGAAPAPLVSTRLSERQQTWIRAADTFFIASFHPQGGADASHRGGLPGFVRVSGPNRLAFDDYPGNAMFNTLGNLAAHPQAGLLFVDFSTGDLLQLAGRACVSPDFSLSCEVDSVRETAAASPLRYRLVEYSRAIPAPSHEPPAGITNPWSETTRRKETR